MKAMVQRSDASDEFYIQERCHITELSNSEDDPAVSIARARVAPGVSTRWHRLRQSAERYLILSGRGRVEMGDLPPQTVSAGDVVRIPPMCRQRITNCDAEDLVFLAICTPRFFAADYEDLEDPA